MKKLSGLLVVFCLGLVSLACAGLTGASQTAESAATKPPVRATSTKRAATPLAESTITETIGTPTIDIFGLPVDFPVYSGSEVESDSTFQNEDGYGHLKLQAPDSLDKVSVFYKEGLLAGDWIFLYGESDNQCGWKEVFIRGDLVMQLVYTPGVAGTTVEGRYDVIDPARLASVLPADFPRPDNSEVTNLSDSFVELYVDQDPDDVYAFYLQALAVLIAQGWKEGIWSGIEASCGDDSGCGGGCELTSGVIPVPTSTRDPRGTKTLVWSGPNNDEYQIMIFSAGAGTRVWVTINRKNPASAGLPEGFPIYQGAQFLDISLGSLMYLAPADAATVTQFYEDALTAAGWEKGELTWKKGSIEVMVFISDAGEDQSSVILSCTGCETP